MDGHAHQDHSGLREYLQVLRRRKWIALLAIVLVPAAAVTFSHFQKAKYQASAEVLLSRQNLAASLNNVTDPNLGVQADRLAQTQADLAQVPPVIQRALRAAHLTGLTVGQFAAASSVTAKTDADLLVFKFASGDPALAARLTTAYAAAYISYRKQLDTQALARARAQVQERITQLEANGEQKSALYASLVERDQQLATMQALQTSNASLVRTAQGASKIQPRPVRNGVLGLMLGIILGLGLAFLREALDTKVRTSEEITNRLDLPILARIPEPDRDFRNQKRLVMVGDPGGTGAEPYRVLRTNVEFANLEVGAKTIMMTSALEGDGKSTTVANLAVSVARSGKHVILVDLDLRRPFLGEFFPVGQKPGLTDVALRHVELEEALIPYALTDGPNWSLRARRKPTNGVVTIAGTLEVMGTGPLPPNPGEFVGSKPLEAILASLAKRADMVLIDAPPLLSIGDALTLSAKVDALILVARIDRLRRPMVREVRRILDGSPAKPLGVVIAAAEHDASYAYGYYSRGYRYLRDTVSEWGHVQPRA